MATQGAKNSTSAGLPVRTTSSKLDGSRSFTAELLAVATPLRAERAPRSRKLKRAIMYRDMGVSVLSGKYEFTINRAGGVKAREAMTNKAEEATW